MGAGGVRDAFIITLLPLETSLDLVQSSAQIEEGNIGIRFVSLCVMLDSDLVLERDINLILNTQQVTAS